MISVIVTCYNLEDYISRCLESLINQTHKNLEIIVVNDKSTDSSLDIINEYVERDSRIRLINNEENYGAGKSRKIGIESAKGDYISLIDGDDYVTKNFLKNLYDLSKIYDADIVSGNIVCDVIRDFDNNKEFITELEKINFLRQEKKTFINNKLIKKTIWDKVPYCERRYIEDTFPYYQLIYHANKIVSDENNENDYYYYYMRDSSLTHKASLEKHRLFVALCAIDLYDFFQTYPKSEFNRIINKFSLRNGVGDFLNHKKINHEEVRRQFPNEYNELITRWEKIKPTLK